jgi:uncharacterized membrane protein
MNTNLIFKLSLFGLAMSIATVYIIPSKVEPLFWLVIFIYCAYTIATQCTGRYFLHGFLVSLLNSVWITAGHVLLFSRYMANHPDEAAMMANMPMPEHPRLMMLLTGPVAGVFFGLILGLFSFVASKMVKKPV